MVPRNTVISVRASFVRLLAFLSFLLASSYTFADAIVYSNFGSGIGYFPRNTGLSINHTDVNSNTGVIPFILGSTTDVNMTFVGTAISIDPFNSPIGSTNIAWLSLRSDAAGRPGSFIASSDRLPINQNETFYNFSFSAQPLLTAGAKYWIEADINVGQSVLWGYSTSFATGIVYRSVSGGTVSEQYANSVVNYQPAFNVTGVVASVPEPSSLAILAAGLFALTREVKRRVKSFRLSETLLLTEASVSPS